LVPEPSKVDDIAADAAKRGAIAFLVSIDPPDTTVRVNITARESQLAKIDALAAAAGLTRSGYMVRAAIGEKNQSARPRRAHRAGKTQIINEAFHARKKVR
ncbi:MAG: type II toxin-antitoxin system HicB family antitoxin, partial [Candidatus Sulfotelmatobacter sp.]